MPPCLAVSSRCARLPPAPYARSSWVPPSTSSSTRSQCVSKPSRGGRLIVRHVLATNDPWAVYRDVDRGPELAICELCSTVHDHFDHCGVGKLQSFLDLDIAHFKSCVGLEARAFRTRTEAWLAATLLYLSNYPAEERFTSWNDAYVWLHAF